MSNSCKHVPHKDSPESTEPEQSEVNPVFSSTRNPGLDLKKITLLKSAQFSAKARFFRKIRMIHGFVPVLLQATH